MRPYSSIFEIGVLRYGGSKLTFLTSRTPDLAYSGTSKFPVKKSEGSLDRACQITLFHRHLVSMSLLVGEI